MVAPVGPALTTASDLPSAVSRAASTTDACSRERTAATGSSSLEIASGAGTIWATPSRGASSTGSPKTRSAMPSEAAARAPSIKTSIPRSTPLPSSATTTSRRLLRFASGAATVWVLLRGGGAEILGSLLRDDLAPGVGAARRADPVRKARAVAAGAAVESRRRHGMGRTPLVAPGAGSSLLRDGHKGEDGS
jgi:hypothetical protein